MKMISKRAYERPQTELFCYSLENSVLQVSIQSDDPVPEAKEGEGVEGWSWD